MFQVQFDTKSASSASLPHVPLQDPNHLMLSDETIDAKTRIMHIQGHGDIEASLDDFKIVSQAGEGTHGQVSKVRYKDTEVFVAMKEMELDTSSQQCMRRIITELEILKHTVECPHIVTYYASYCHLASVYIVMELMDLGSLDLLCRHASATPICVPEHVLSIMCKDTTKALEFLHSKLHIIHRDVKPANLLLNSRGEIKLCDFSVSGQLVKSCARTYVGTMYYMAPERIQPELSKQYTPKADVWSLGVTLIELALGRYPFPKESSPFKMLVHIVEGQSPTSKLTPDTFSECFIDFVSKCVKQVADHRASFRELLTHPFVVEDRQPSEVVQWVRSQRPELLIP